MRMSYFEIIMLLCFGLAWPFNISRSIRSKTAKGKSVFFLYMLEVGYLAGILHKIFFYYDFVIWLYVLNFFMVFADILLYYRNCKLDKARDEKQIFESN